jgi:hypothetical protein
MASKQWIQPMQLRGVSWANTLKHGIGTAPF